MNDQLLTVKQLAEFLNCPGSSIYQMIFRAKHDDNPIPYLKIGQRVRFKRPEIEVWLERQAVNVTEGNDDCL